MPWIEKLDARSRTWRTPTRWLYLGIKWYLVGLGAFALIRLSLDRTGIWPFFH